jgi:hypothetical protein
MHLLISCRYAFYVIIIALSLEQIMVRRWVNYKTINGFKVMSQWHDDKGKLRFTIICKVCGNEFDKAFSTLNKYKTKSCGCLSSYIKPLGKYVNGFKILKCLGLNAAGDRRVSAECKICQRVYEVTATKLKFNKSCGCLAKNGTVKSKYWKAHTRLMDIYSNMKARCYNKNTKAYKNYGGRGIAICDEWLNNSNTFCEWALKNNYTEFLTIDRIDNDKGYSPENCRWTSIQIQSQNKRNNTVTADLVIKIRKDLECMKGIDVAKKYNIHITEFTVAPNIAQNEGKSYHEWFVEFENKPNDMSSFSLEVDNALREKNIYYNDLIKGNILQPLVIRSLPKNTLFAIVL